MFKKMFRKLQNLRASNHLRKKGMLATLMPFFGGRVSTSALKFIFVLVLVYLVVITFALIVQEVTVWLKDVIIYSVMGFVTFFMGFFGWELARDIRNYQSKN